MSVKESILLVSVIISLIVIGITFSKLNKLKLSKSKRSLLIYVTLIIPFLGLYLVSRVKE